MGKKKTEARKRMPFVAVLAALLAVILLFAAFAASYIRKFDSTIKEEKMCIRDRHWRLLKSKSYITS